MNKLKIGIVCPYDYFRFGGVQEHVRAVYEELKTQGYDVKVLVPNSRKSRRNDNPDVIRLGSATKVNTPMGTTADFTFSATRGEIDKVLDREKFDVIHFHEPWVPLLSRQILSKSKAKNLATFHAKLPENMLNKSVQKAWLPYGRRVMKYLDGITAVSDAAMEFVSLAAPTQKIEIIPNGINLSEFDENKTEFHKKYLDKLPTILYIGRLEKRKGVDYLLKAYRRLLEDHPKVRLLIAGDGPKARTLKAYATRFNLERVHFLGFVSDEEKKQLLKTCDVFCSPAIYGESFGIVLLEAMAMGAPIVAGNNPGYASVLKDTGRLSLVDPTSELDFAYRLEMMLFDEKIAKDLIDWGKEYVKQFDYKLVTDNYLDLYSKISKK